MVRRQNVLKDEHFVGAGKVHDIRRRGTHHVGGRNGRDQCGCQRRGSSETFHHRRIYDPKTQRPGRRVTVHLNCRTIHTGEYPIDRVLT